MNDFLTGSNANLSTVVNRTIDKLRGLTQEGNYLVLTIDAEVQRSRSALLEGECAALPSRSIRKPARVLAMASSPTVQPESRRGPNSTEILAARGPCTPAAPLLNRATQGLFIPGSTFKVLTASAALESGRYHADAASSTRATASSTARGSQLRRPERAGSVRERDLQGGAAALDQLRLLRHRQGARAVADPRAGRALRLLRAPPLETPRASVAERPLPAAASSSSRTIRMQVDPGRLAFGQERLLATPLQMAMVAAGIANGGRRHAPLRRRPHPEAGRRRSSRRRAPTSTRRRSSRRPPSTSRR